MGHYIFHILAKPVWNAPSVLSYLRWDFSTNKDVALGAIPVSLCKVPKVKLLRGHANSDFTKLETWKIKKPHGIINYPSE